MLGHTKPNDRAMLGRRPEAGLVPPYDLGLISGVVGMPQSTQPRQSIKGRGIPGEASEGAAKCQRRTTTVCRC